MSVLHLPLRNTGRAAIIDEADAPLVSGYLWHENHGYARAVIDGERRYLHQIILGATHGEEVDHRNGNGLDNRRENLRFATRGEQCRNRQGNHTRRSSTYKGVTRLRIGWWQVAIGVDEVVHNLGIYLDEIEAAKAYDAAARYYHGQFARTNLPGNEALPADEILRRCRAMKPYQSKYRGVSRGPDGKGWRGTIYMNGKCLHIGLFVSAEEAAMAYDRLAVQRDGAKAKTNFPPA